MAILHPFRGRWLLFSWGLLVGSAWPAAAQTVPDTTHLHYGEEMRLPSAADVPLRVQQEQRSLWKLGLNNFLPYFNSSGPTRYGLHLAYERKLRHPAWSVLAEVSPALTRYNSDANPDGRQHLTLRSQVAGRYYYNQEKRLRQGRNARNFSANYLSVALGAGLGQDAHETSFFSYDNRGRRFVAPDLALLWGWQRRLGRYGFVDANVGAAALLLAGESVVRPVASLRLGLLLGPQPAKYVRQLASASEVTTLQPRFYVGVAQGDYAYHVRYSTQNPYPAPSVKTSPTETQTTSYPTTGYGGYVQHAAEGAVPYVYAGYQLAPRFALQIGLQYGETLDNARVGTVFKTPAGALSVPNQTLRQRGLAMPVLLRYALTPAFLHRWQFDALAGVVPVWSAVSFHEYAVANHQATTQETFGFERRAFGLQADLGADVSYAFGRRRRLQVNAEFVLSKDLQTFSRFNPYDQENGAYLTGGGSFGLRYRFGYR